MYRGRDLAPHLADKGDWLEDLELFRTSAAEFRGFEPAYGFALMRDDFSLPHKSHRHYAHSNHADNQKERLLCF